MSWLFARGNVRAPWIVAVLVLVNALPAADYATLELDLSTLKGKTEPERADALLGGVAMAQTAAYQELVRRQTEFLAQYRSGAFVEALELIAGCQEAADALGVYVAKEK